MSTVVAQVRVLRRNPRDPSFERIADLPYISGKDSKTGEHFVWSSSPQERVLDEECLKLLQADPWLEVRVLDARAQADKKLELAAVADTAARQAEDHAKILRAKADALLSDAQAASEAVSLEPVIEVEAPKPFTDQVLAALPDNVREALDTQKLSLEDVKTQMHRGFMQKAADSAQVKNDMLAKSRAQAIGKSKK